MDKFFTGLQKPSKQTDPKEEMEQGTDGTAKKALPKGVVLGKDGKPCRSCTSFAAWAQMTKQQEASSPQKNVAQSTSSNSLSSSITSPTSLASSTSSTSQLPAHCPPDVEVLGRSTWTFLHALSASYPKRATPSQGADMRTFLSLFSNVYPCWHCAEDFRDWMSKPGNAPRVGGQEELGRWMCDAHNEVNRKLGKGEFDCRFWKERWIDGPSDGSCG